MFVHRSVPLSKVTLRKGASCPLLLLPLHRKSLIFQGRSQSLLMECCRVYDLFYLHSSFSYRSQYPSIVSDNQRAEYKKEFNHVSRGGNGVFCTANVAHDPFACVQKGPWEIVTSQRVMMQTSFLLINSKKRVMLNTFKSLVLWITRC